MKQSKRLPDKPSELIRVALKDLDIVEALPDVYHVNMSSWHLKADPAVPSSRCDVCLAGAVISQELGAQVGVSTEPMDYDHDTANKLYALDYFRRGEIQEGLGMLGVKSPQWDTLPYNTAITPYDTSPQSFKAELETMATLFDKVGL